MANPYLTLFCDPAANKIYSAWRQNVESQTPILKQGDEIGVELHWVKKGYLTAVMEEIPFPPSCTINLAVGLLDQPPIGGTFTISYGGDTTDPLDSAVLAADLATAINALPSIAAEGGVTVLSNGVNFRILWNDVGVRTNTLTVDTASLYPTSQASVIETRAGSASASRSILLKITQGAMAACSSFTAVEQPSISISRVFGDTWRVKIEPNPKEGVFSLTLVIGANSYTTAAISSDADAVAFNAALANLGITNATFSVLKSGDYSWDVTVPSSVDNITSESGLVGFSAMYGVLNLNTAEVEEFLAGSDTGTAKLEVQVQVNGETMTIAQCNVSILNDLIDDGSFNIVQRQDVMPVESVVRYDTSQALTSAQKLTARQNIDAISLSDVSDSFDLSNIPTVNEKNAMQHSVLPSTTNPFVTMSERNPFDQSLNTTNNVGFRNVVSTVTGGGTTTISGDSITSTDGTISLNVQPSGVTFSDATKQVTAFLPANYTTTANLSANYLSKAGNLSGLASVATARTNLGLGSMALASAADYYTSVASNNLYLAKSNNLSDIASAFSARSNLGLGTMSTENSSDYLSKSGNLFGLQDVGVSRANLGLGSSNSVSFGTVNVAAGTVLINSNGIEVGNHLDISGSSIIVNNGSTTATFGVDGINISGSAGSIVEVDTPSGVSAQLGGTGGGANGVGVWVGSVFSYYTGFDKDGFVFPDGTKQTTAASGAEESYDMCAYDWSTHTSPAGGWTFSDSGSRKKMNTSVGVGYGSASMHFNMQGILALKPVPVGKVRPMRMKFSIAPYSDQLFIGLFGNSTIPTDRSFNFGLAFTNGDNLNYSDNLFIYYKGSGNPEYIDTGISLNDIYITNSQNYFRPIELDLHEDGSLELRAYTSTGSALVFTRGPQTATYNNGLHYNIGYAAWAGVSAAPMNPNNASDYYPSVEVGKFLLTLG